MVDSQGQRVVTKKKKLEAPSGKLQKRDRVTQVEREKDRDRERARETGGRWRESDRVRDVEVLTVD